jgi:hypothetical protein
MGCSQCGKSSGMYEAKLTDHGRLVVIAFIRYFTIFAAGFVVNTIALRRASEFRAIMGYGAPDSGWLKFFW